MSRFEKGFLIGAATAAHQVEGNNKNSDFWVLENLPHSVYLEPSSDAVDHYNRYEEDIKLLASAGLNAYRFTIEWARIQPTKDGWNDNEVAHYRKVLECCHAFGVTPIVTMHHFSSPKWLISNGGWENPETSALFAAYCERIVEELGDLFMFVNTINEANMGVQFKRLIRDMTKRMSSGIQVGVNMSGGLEKQMAYMRESIEAFGCPTGVHTVQSALSAIGDGVVIEAHCKARDAMKKVKPDLKIGISLSLHDIQVEKGGEIEANVEWAEEFTHYLPYIYKDDFIGVQNYTRKIVGGDGEVIAPGGKLTQMGYENYPEALANVIRAVAKEYAGDIYVTENGIATDNDDDRIKFIKTALDGVEKCIKDGIAVKGYLHWSLLDNFEWQLAYTRTFGLIAVDRKTQKRTPKKSLAYIGSQK